MNALLLLLLALTPQAPPPRVPIGTPIPVSTPDGKVTGLNEPAFRVLQSIKKKNPGALTEIDAHSITAAVLLPEKVKGDAPSPPAKLDAIERDLLEELTSSTFRRIVVTMAGNSAEQVVFPPATGKAREILRGILYPVPNFEAEWVQGLSGFQVIVNDYKNSPARQERIITFIQGKLAQKWAASNPANGYKPLRGELTERDSYASALGSDANLARTILYKAMQALDKAENDRVPNSIYDSLKPR